MCYIRKMQRILLILMLLIMTIMPVSCLTLEGGVTYTVESARKEAFSGVKYKIPVSTFRKYLKDPNFDENQAAIAAGRVDLGDRVIGLHSDGSYAVVFRNDSYKVYYFDPKGMLEEIDIRQGVACPTKAYSYNTKGQLISVSFIVTLDNIYTYSVDGALIAHRIGDVSYDANGKEIVRKVK